ncbi:MAG: zinc-ribbon domain-containing protein [Methanobrevibacter sp.]|nr:zinc-ribbon domain-containing protein [Methanobrevibacter sp.]
MGNFCTNCGAKIGEDYNFCINCGTKIDKSAMKKEISQEAEKQENNNMTGGGYCSFNCIHYCEEYMDSDGGIVGDFNSDGYVEYYCNLGHQISDGSFCKYYE